MDDLKLYAKREKGLESLVQPVRIFNDDSGMEIDIERRAKLVPEKRKITKLDRISLHDGRFMKRLIEWAGYKYLVILQADEIWYTEMKKKMTADLQGYKD